MSSASVYSTMNTVSGPSPSSVVMKKFQKVVDIFGGLCEGARMYYEDHQANVKRLNELKTKGFRFDITADKYQAWCNEVYLGGASVKLPREKPLHWRHRSANIRENVKQCLLLADFYRFNQYENLHRL